MKFSTFIFIIVAFTMIDRNATAAEFIPYSKEKFVELQKKDKKILLQYHASWCPICKRQRNVLETLQKIPAFSEIQFVSANFDTDKEVSRQYAVQMQSALILFQGTNELKRSQGITDKAQLTEFLSRPASQPIKN